MYSLLSYRSEERVANERFVYRAEGRQVLYCRVRLISGQLKQVGRGSGRVAESVAAIALAVEILSGEEANDHLVGGERDCVVRQRAHHNERRAAPEDAPALAPVRLHDAVRHVLVDEALGIGLQAVLHHVERHDAGPRDGPCDRTGDARARVDAEPEAPPLRRRGLDQLRVAVGECRRRRGGRRGDWVLRGEGEGERSRSRRAPEDRIGMRERLVDVEVEAVRGHVAAGERDGAAVQALDAAVRVYELGALPRVAVVHAELVLAVHLRLHRRLDHLDGHRDHHVGEARDRAGQHRRRQVARAERAALHALLVAQPPHDVEVRAVVDAAGHRVRRERRAHAAIEALALFGNAQYRTYSSKLFEFKVNGREY